MSTISSRGIRGSTRWVRVLADVKYYFLGKIQSTPYRSKLALTALLMVFVWFSKIRFSDSIPLRSYRLVCTLLQSTRDLFQNTANGRKLVVRLTPVDLSHSKVRLMCQYSSDGIQIHRRIEHLSTCVRSFTAAFSQAVIALHIDVYSRG